MADEPRWKPILDIVWTITIASDPNDALTLLAKLALDLIPADRGSALFMVEGGVPWCIRWPEYSTSRVPQFNSHYNKIIPVETDPGREVLGPVEWKRYGDSEYVTDFHEPLGIRCSVGAAFEDRFTSKRYILWIHRHGVGAAFQEEEATTLRALCAGAANVISLHSEMEALKSASIWDAELGPDAEILSRRESEVARLICRRLSMREIATILRLSPRTIERHALHIYRKLNVAGRKELATFLLKGYREGNE